MDGEEVLSRIREEKIIAIVRGIDKADILDVAGALHNGGINCIEITFDHTSQEGMRNTIESITKLRDQWGDQINIGAGTVLSIEDVDAAVKAGADYIISPDTNVDVIVHTKEAGKISMPGSLTPSEAILAYKTGADVVKMFPAGVLGLSYLKAVMAPLAHIPMCAVGGIDIGNIGDFIKAGITCFGIGGNLVSRSLINSQEFDKLAKLAEKYKRAVGR